MNLKNEEKKEKAFYDILSLIYCNYELNLYDSVDLIAFDIKKLLTNYVGNQDLYIGFIR